MDGAPRLDGVSPYRCVLAKLTGRATLCGAGLRHPLFPSFSFVWIFSSRLNFEAIFGRFLPAMNLVSPARDYCLILACVIEIMRFNWINL